MDSTFLLALISAFLLGISKGGIKGLGIAVVSIMALAYDAKSSTGILLPLLCVGDVLAVIYFRKFVKWKYLIQFLPPMIIGVLVAVYVGQNLNEIVFKRWMSAIILISVVYMFWNEYKPINIPKIDWKFSGLVGFGAGFTTMMGNLAGPFANLYFLATKIPKNQLVGTTAWVFMIINLFKLPFHVFSWKTIDMETLTINVYLIPAVIIGFYIGVRILQLFSESAFRKFVLLVTAIGAIMIFLS